MDVGNPGYQAAWLSNVLADLRAGGWDGVFMDDTNADMGWHLGGRTIARYPTSAAWRAATRSMLAKVGPALISAGFLAVPNLSTPWAADYDAQATWSDWLRFTSGAAQEYYGKWGMDSSGWFAGNDWTYRQQFQELTEQAGKIFLGITYAPRGDTQDDDLGAGELPPLRPAGERRRARLRAHRPRGAGPVLVGLDGRRRHSARGAVPGRRRLAAQLLGRDGAREPDLLVRDRPARPAVRARRREDHDVGQARPDQRRDPPLSASRRGPRSSFPRR